MPTTGPSTALDPLRAVEGLGQDVTRGMLASDFRSGAALIAEARPAQYRQLRRLLDRAYGGYAGAIAPAVFEV
jgi:hypothetical protein